MMVVSTLWMIKECILLFENKTVGFEFEMFKMQGVISILHSPLNFPFLALFVTRFFFFLSPYPSSPFPCKTGGREEWTVKTDDLLISHCLSQHYKATCPLQLLSLMWARKRLRSEFACVFSLEKDGVTGYFCVWKFSLDTSQHPNKAMIVWMLYNTQWYPRETHQRGTSMFCVTSTKDGTHIKEQGGRERRVCLYFVVVIGVMNDHKD